MLKRVFSGRFGSRETTRVNFNVHETGVCWFEDGINNIVNNRDCMLCQINDRQGMRLRYSNDGSSNSLCIIYE